MTPNIQDPMLPLDESGEDTNKLTLRESTTLHDINIRVKQGELVCIIGQVGSGKSSFISSIVGDMIYLHPNIISHHG